MSVNMQQFRVVGVSTKTGEDVSVVIDAATKAAAEVKAEQMDIETTHIVRIKQEEPTPPDEHELFSAEAAEALAGKRTVNLIEEVIAAEEPRPAPAPAPTVHTPPATSARNKPVPNQVIAAITRPTYASPASQREPAAEVSGLRAFGVVLLVLLGITAGAYFVLVHEPNNVNAQHEELLFGEDLFSDVVPHVKANTPAGPARDAFDTRVNTRPPAADKPPIAADQQIVITPATAQAEPKPLGPADLVLQSVVTSHEGRFAVINGRLYKQGSTIAGHKLVNVADDWVLMEHSGKQFVLQIEQGATD